MREKQERKYRITHYVDVDITGINMDDLDEAIKEAIREDLEWSNFTVEEVLA